MAKTKTAPSKAAAPKPIAPPGGFRHGGKTYRTGQPLPRKYASIALGKPLTRDPSDGMPRVPPGYGQYPIQQVTTHQGQMGVLAHVYRTPDEALRHSVENARFMRNDCSVMECVEARQLGTALLPWSIEIENQKDAREVYLKKCMTRLIDNIPNFTEYRRNLLEALWYGRYANQHSYGFLHTTDGKRYATIKSWLPINGDKLVFRYDDGTGRFTGDEVGIRRGVSWATGDVVNGNRKLEPVDGQGMAYFLTPQERARVVIHKHLIEDGSFETPISAGRIHGVGIRDRIYWTWYQKQETMAALMEVIQRTGAGIMIYRFPFGNKSAEAKVHEIAEENQQSNILFVPSMPGDPSMDAFDVTRVEPSSVGIDAMKSIIHEFFGWQIKRYALGQTLTSEAQATGMNSGVADAHMQSYQRIVTYDAAKLEETITTELVRPLQKINFRWADGIQCKFKIQVDDGEADRKLQAFKLAWDMGAEIPAGEVMDAIGCAMPKADEKTLFNPQLIQEIRAIQTGGDQPSQQPGQEQQSLEDMFGPLLKGEGDSPPSGGSEEQNQDEPQLQEAA